MKGMLPLMAMSETSVGLYKAFGLGFRVVGFFREFSSASKKEAA